MALQIKRVRNCSDTINVNVRMRVIMKEKLQAKVNYLNEIRWQGRQNWTMSDLINHLVYWLTTFNNDRAFRKFILSLIQGNGEVTLELPEVEEQSLTVNLRVSDVNGQ